MISGPTSRRGVIEGRGLADVVWTMCPDDRSVRAWDPFDEIVRQWLRETGPRVVLEVGGGRRPLLRPSEIDEFRLDHYIVNDVSSSELEVVSALYETACFDIQVGPKARVDYWSSCDFVFSKMVFEHVQDPRGAWTAILHLLRDGGTALALVPVLYSPPFVANKLLPLQVSGALLKHFFPWRTHAGNPKFPAYYRWCRASTPYMRKRLEPIGFRNVQVVPFYGHGYFERLPGLRQSERFLSSIAQRRELPWLASYAYITATK